jgi:hypothetical protein
MICLHYGQALYSTTPVRSSPDKAHSGKNGLLPIKAPGSPEPVAAPDSLSPTAGNSIPELGCSALELGCSVSELGCSDSELGCFTLEFGCSGKPWACPGDAANRAVKGAPVGAYKP